MWAYFDNLLHPNRQNNEVSVSSWRLTTGQFGNKIITGVATNNTDQQVSYAQIEFNVYDTSDNQVGSTITNITNLEPHGKWEFQAPVIEDSATKVKLKKVTSY